MAELHKCAVPDCLKRIPYDKLMCLDHWRKVSSATQREIYRTLNAWRAARLSQWPYRNAVEQAKREAMA